MKFSIITVVKDEISKIGLTIQSLKNQSFKDYEHIIFDGESTDGTSEFLKKMFNIVAKSIKPSKDEIDLNPRSRSAKLNILEKAIEDHV